MVCFIGLLALLFGRALSSDDAPPTPPPALLGLDVREAGEEEAKDDESDAASNLLFGCEFGWLLLLLLPLMLVANAMG